METRLKQKCGFAGFIAAVCLFAGGQSRSAAADLFTITTQPVHALEGGPVILKATIRYQGTDSMKIRDWRIARNSGFFVTAPPSWKEREDNVAWGAIVSKEIKPGDSFVETVYVHHEFSAIPAGKAKLKLEWPVFQLINFQDKEGFSFAKVAVPTAELEVDIAKADSQRLTALAKQVATALSDPTLDLQREREIANTILWVKHPVLLPSCLELLKPRPTGEQYRKLRSFPAFLETWSVESDEVKQKLVDFLRDFGTDYDGPILDFWRSQQVGLTAGQVATIMQSRNISIRVRTCSYYPDLCPAGTRELLLRELGDLRREVETVK
jgi:hypothetical protein